MRHRCTVLIAQQRREAVGAEVLEQASFQVVGDAVVLGWAPPSHERRRKQRRDVAPVSALAKPAADERRDDIAQQPRLVGKLREAPLAQELTEQDVWGGVVSREPLVPGV